MDITHRRQGHLQYKRVPKILVLHPEECRTCECVAGKKATMGIVNAIVVNSTGPKLVRGQRKAYKLRVRFPKPPLVRDDEDNSPCEP